MANDNQTALMISIKRKKDRIEDLFIERQVQRDKYRNVGIEGWNITIHGPRPSEITAKIYELEFQITEDEKLLEVEKEHFDQFGISNQKEAFDYRDGSTDYCRTPKDLYNEKYGSDEK